jgi:UMF1 family MFS transporter
MAAKKREVFGWALFDVANSSYTTIIITVAFNSVFSELIVGPKAGTTNDFSMGNLLWGLIISASAFLSAIAAPLLGAMSDVGQSRKKYLFLSVLVCSGATSGLFFAGTGDVWLAALLVIVSSFGFSLSENFISSFLPHVSNNKNIAKISGLAWGLGYLGGLLSIVLIQTLVGLEYRAQRWDQLKWIGPLTGLFFVLFSIPTFLLVKEPINQVTEAARLKSISMSQTMKEAVEELKRTFRSLIKYQDLANFLLGFLFFQGGVAIVVSFASLYGKQEVGIEGSWQTVFFVSLQITAAVGALFFGWLQHKVGALFALNLTLGIWIITVLLIYFLDPVSALFPMFDKKAVFIAIGNLAGLCLGATQSSARTIVGMFAPPARSGEFYGFWGLVGKLASVLANLSFAVLQAAFSLKIAMLMCSAFFVVGYLFTRKVNEARGVAASET